MPPLTPAHDAIMLSESVQHKITRLFSPCPWLIMLQCLREPPVGGWRCWDVGYTHWYRDTTQGWDLCNSMNIYRLLSLSDWRLDTNFTSSLILYPPQSNLHCGRELLCTASHFLLSLRSWSVWNCWHWLCLLMRLMSKMGARKKDWAAAEVSVSWPVLMDHYDLVVPWCDSRPLGRFCEIILERESNRVFTVI